MKPCKRNHTGGRYKSGACIECMALRKGSDRKVPQSRADKIVRTLANATKILKEERKARNEQARVDRRRAKEEKARISTEAAAERQRIRDETEAKKNAARNAAVDAHRDEVRQRIDARKSAPRGADMTPAEISASNDANLQPPAEVLETVRVDSEGRVTRTPILGRDGLPVKAVPALHPAHIVPTPETADNHRLKQWQREGRQPTRAELAAEHTGQTAGRSTIFELESAGNGADDVSGPNGIRTPPPDDGSRSGWRQSGANWTKKL